MKRYSTKNSNNRLIILENFSYGKTVECANTVNIDIIEVSEVDAVYFNGVWNELINKAMQDMSSYDEELAKLRDIMIVMITYRGYDINNKVEPEII